MLEALSTSDFHLEGMSKHFLDATNRQLKEVDKIYQYAMSKGVQHIFWPGDLSDTPKMSFGTYMKLVMFLKKYDGIINTYYIGGNHDRSDVENTSCDLLKLLQSHGFFKSFRIFLEPEQDRIDGTLVNFCAWPCKESMSEKEGALNMAHVEYNGAIGDNGRKMKVNKDFASYKRDFTVSGHIHQYQHMKQQRVIFNGTRTRRTLVRPCLKASSTSRLQPQRTWWKCGIGSLITIPTLSYIRLSSNRQQTSLG